MDYHITAIAVWYHQQILINLEFFREVRCATDHLCVTCCADAVHAMLVIYCI